jgi:non-ribosomal peptide synthetase component F
MGSCVCIPSDLARHNNLSQALNKMVVTVAVLTLLVLVVLSPAELPCLKTLIMGGEPAPIALIERWAQYVHLINGYGPAETSLAAVMNEQMPMPTRSNIGWAVGYVTWIEDPFDYKHLAPIGSIGELLIEGQRLVRAI